MVAIPDVNSLMADGLADWLASQQTARDEAKATAAFRLKVGVGVAVAVLVFGLIMSFRSSFLFWLCAMIGFGGWAWAEAAKRPVINAIKVEMNQRIAAAMGFTFAHQGETGRDVERALSHGLLPDHDRLTAEDFWNGDVDGLGLSLCELHLEERRGSGKNRRWETVFRGPLMQVRFAREFHGATLVERDGTRLRTMFSLFGAGDTLELDGIRFQRSAMVDPAFEDVFDVWTTDPMEARYLVHPAYCERLVALEQSFSGKALRALFHGGSLIIAVETEPLFESGSLDADRDRDLMADTIRQFGELATLARALNERPRG